MQDGSLDGLAGALRQRGDTCVLASGFFRFAELHSLGVALSDEMYQDLSDLLQGNFREVGMRFSKDSPTMFDLEVYAHKNGLEVVACEPSRDSVVGNIGEHPIVLLGFDFGSWSMFYGSGNLNDWYSGHVICAVGAKDGFLEYFEPLAGELRRRALSSLDGLYAGVLVIRSS